MRGRGRVFKRGRTFWIAYYHHGEEIRESAKTGDEKIAQKKLDARLKTTGTTHFVGPKEERVRYDDLAALYQADYRQNKLKTASDAERYVRQLRTFFGRERALKVPERVNDYIEARLADYNKKGDPIANGTVNRELSALRRMFRLAVRAKKLSSVPFIPMLAEDNAREGFFEAADFEAVATHLPTDIADAARFAFLTGWRKGEITSLEWRDVDTRVGTIRLRRARSKSKKGRVLKLTRELLDLIRRRAGLRRPECVFVFHRNGKPLRSFRISWQKACKAAGFEGRLFHDLRRSAVRNMVRAGVPHNIAMRISGHKTDSVFWRYDIVDEEDLAEALTLTQDYVERQRHETPKVTPLRPVAGQVEDGQNTDNRTKGGQERARN